MPPEMVVRLVTLALPSTLRGSYVQRHSLAGDQVAEEVQAEAQDVRNHGHKQDELGVLLLAPGPLEVAAAVEDGEARRDESEHILLHHRRQSEDPRIYDRLSGHDGEVGHAVAHANEGLLDLLHPVRVRSQGEVEEREDDEAREQAPRQRWEVYSCHGVRARVCVRVRRRGQSEGGSRDFCCRQRERLRPNVVRRACVELAWVEPEVVEQRPRDWPSAWSLRLRRSALDA